MELALKQRGVLKGVVAGVIITVAGITLTIISGDEKPISLETVADRIRIALQWDLVVLLCLVYGIGRLASHRFFTPEDIDGGGLSEGTARSKLLQSMLQNTLEQATLAFMVHLIWAVTMPSHWQSVIPTATILFLTGRILFYAGYAKGAPSRALGFALTFYPSVLMLIIMIIYSGIDKLI